MTGIIVPSPLGEIAIAEEQAALVYLDFAEALPAGCVQGTNALLEQAAGQLDQYFAGALTAFDVPLRLVGTVFQRRVWQALLDIPYGETRTYGQIAAQVGAPKAARAVGGANHVNPISIIVPCHRVIGADGRMVGYGGGLWRKEALLQLERDNLVKAAASGYTIENSKGRETK